MSPEDARLTIADYAIRLADRIRAGEINDACCHGLIESLARHISDRPEVCREVTEYGLKILSNHTGHGCCFPKPLAR